MYEIGLLFLDQQGNATEGCIGKDRVAMFRERLKENAVYKIEEVMIASQKLRHRIIKIRPEPKDFPFYTYNIKSFDDLEVRTGDNTYVSDAIGIKSFDDLAHIPCNFCFFDLVRFIPLVRLLNCCALL